MQTKLHAVMLIILLGGGAACSSLEPKLPPLHQRFWRGYQRTDLKQPVFEKKLNEEFFSLYPASVPDGLVSYLPVLPVRSKNGGPNEWALVSYQSQDHYDKFKQTDLGKESADAHWKVFSRDVSLSSVVEPFEGQIQVNHAYVTDPDFRKYADAKVVFVLYHLSVGGHNAEDLAENIEHNHGATKRLLQNVVFIVTRDQVAEYLFFRPDADLSGLLPSLNADQVITLRDGVPGKDTIHEGQGLKSQL